MSHDVSAATRERGRINGRDGLPGRPRSFGALGDRALTFALSFQFRFDLARQQTVYNVVFRQPSFARNTDPEPQILETFDAVGVRIDYALHSSLFSARPPAPVEIKPFRSRVKLDPSAGTRRHIENCRDVDLVRLAFQQQAAGRM